MNALPTPLIDAEALRERAGATDLVLLDCSFDLMDTALGERQFIEAHLPGAHYLHLERDLSGDKFDAHCRFRGRHPLPTREAFAATVGALGLTPASAVVVYDRQGSMYAARAWWMLGWIGHRAAAVLDGGLQAWQDVGGALAAGAATTAPARKAPYPLAEAGVRTIDAQALLVRLGTVMVLDARAGERFRGEVEPLDAQAGHIPGALNRFFKDNLGPDGRFRDAASLKRDYAALIGATPAAQVVHQCGSGVTACHNLLAMAAAGLDGGVLYPGSWSEWSADPARPVARSA
jgi:thiosulfate/3-mercaptopyruvate sulfurtransferase